MLQYHWKSPTTNLHRFKARHHFFIIYRAATAFRAGDALAPRRRSAPPTAPAPSTSGSARRRKSPSTGRRATRASRRRARLRPDRRLRRGDPSGEVRAPWNSGACTIKQKTLYKGAFTLAIFAHDFALSLHVLLTKIIFFSTKCASLVQNRVWYCASVNAP